MRGEKGASHLGVKPGVNSALLHPGRKGNPCRLYAARGYLVEGRGRHYDQNSIPPFLEGRIQVERETGNLLWATGERGNVSIRNYLQKD